MALDEKRRAFEPTLINSAPHVQEIWFAGAHSDVGGGYYRDGLADICLRLRLVADWTNRCIKLTYQRGYQLQHSAPEEHRNLIAQDDVTVTPDPLALSHQQNYFWFNPLFKLVDRECCVLVDNEQSKLAPTIHYTVAERINRLTSYRPESLKSLHYDVLYSDETRLKFKA